MAVEIGVPGITDAEQIGQGGFGKVYRARQDELNRAVAVKVLTDIDLDAAARHRFTREARAIGRLSGHPNVVDVYAQGITEDGAPYLIMELCTGGSLGDRLKQGQRMSWQDATKCIVEIAGALQTAHAEGILHRDLKPANLLIDSYGTAKLADFGIAHVGNEATMTQTGMLAGSPAHIAPELVAGAKPTPASDVYSLGSTLFALITGNAPFFRETDTSLLTLIQRITREPAPHLSQWGVPAPVADLVARTLAKQPGVRPQSAEDFAQALMAARGALGLPRGDYRVQRAAPVEGDLTMVPQNFPQQGRMGPGPGTPNPGFATGVRGPQPTGPGPYQAATTQQRWAGPPTQPNPIVPHQSIGQHQSVGQGPPLRQPQPLGQPGPFQVQGQAAAVSTPNRTPLIVMCWVVVAVCVGLIIWMLVDRAQRAALVGAPLLRMLLG